MLTGEKFGADVLKGLRLDHYLNFFTDLSQTGEYRFDSTTSLRLKLNSWLALNASVTDFYTSITSPNRLITTIGPSGSVITKVDQHSKEQCDADYGAQLQFLAESGSSFKFADRWGSTPRVRPWSALDLFCLSQSASHPETVAGECKAVRDDMEALI